MIRVYFSRFRNELPQKKEINISAESSEKTDIEFPARVISAIL